MNIKNFIHPFVSYDNYLWRKYHKMGYWNELVKTNKKRALELEWRHVFQSKLKTTYLKFMEFGIKFPT